jgi:excisionase family DNA binding protein
VSADSDPRVAAARAAHAAAIAELLVATNALAEALADARTAPAPQDGDALDGLPSGAVLLKVPEAAAALRVSPGHIYLLIRRHELPRVYIGNKVRVRPEDLRAWAAAHRSGEVAVA